MLLWRFDAPSALTGFQYDLAFQQFGRLCTTNHMPRFMTLVVLFTVVIADYPMKATDSDAISVDNGVTLRPAFIS